MKQLEYVLNNQKEVLGFLKSHYPMYHLSNIFFRDIQYGVQKMFERRGEKVSYVEAEKIAKAFADKLEKEKIFGRIDRQSWVLNYPEFKKPQSAPPAAAKPAPGAAPAKSPAASPAAMRPSLPPLGAAKPAGSAPAGAKPALPPLGSAKPAGTPSARPALPPLSSAKPAASKPSLPPLASAKPVGTVMPAPEATTGEVPKETPASAPTVEAAKAEPPAAETPKPTPAAPAATGAKKTLPPLGGKYTPAGKK